MDKYEKNKLLKIVVPIITMVGICVGILVNLTTISNYLISKDLIHINSMKVIYEPNGARQASYTQDITNDNKILNCNAFSREGYIFLGWSEIKNGDVKYYDEDAIKLTNWHINLYAKWEAIKFTISYINVKNAVNDNAIYYTIEDEINLFALDGRNGYAFQRWLPNNVINKGSIGNKTFDAQWNIIQYNISYSNLNGASNSNPIAYNIEDKIVLQDLSNINGFKFVGWKEGNVIDLGKTGDKTFTAQWTQIYNIQYSGLMHSTINFIPTTYTELDDDIKLLSLSDCGYYDFVRWEEGYETNDESFIWFENNIISKGSIGDKYFRAVYVKNEPIFINFS